MLDQSYRLNPSEAMRTHLGFDERREKHERRGNTHSIVIYTSMQAAKHYIVKRGTTKQSTKLKPTVRAAWRTCRSTAKYHDAQAPLLKGFYL